MAPARWCEPREGPRHRPSPERRSFVRRRSRRGRRLGWCADSVRAEAAGREEREGAGDLDDLRDRHRLPRCVGEPDVAGAVLERGDAADAGVEAQVGAVGGGALVGSPTGDDLDGVGDLSEEAVAVLEAARGELPPGPGDDGRVVAQPGVALCRPGRRPPRERAGRRRGPRRDGRPSGPRRRGGREPSWPSRRSGWCRSRCRTGEGCWRTGGRPRCCGGPRASEAPRGWGRTRRWPRRPRGGCCRARLGRRPRA